MAKRDVQLVIRARNEADRAIDSIAAALRTLDATQEDVAASGERSSNTLEKLAGAFNVLDAAARKIDQALDLSRTSLDAQQASLGENEARYNSLTREIKAAEQAIINTRIAMQSDGSNVLKTKLAGAQAAYKNLVAEAGRLENKIEAQRADVTAASTAYDGLEGAALAAQVAVGDLGDEGERAGRLNAAAARDAEAAYRAEAAAIAATVREQREQAAAQASINAQLGVRDPSTGAARESAAVFEEDARAKRDAAQASEELDRAAARLVARARPLRVEQDRLNAEMAEAKRLFNEGRISIRTYRAEMERLEGNLKRVRTQQNNMNRNGSAEIKGLFGLRPYEMQNLSYQINDVVTQLASGAPVGQVFAQQGGQIIQIFPRLLTGLLKYGRALTVVGLALAPVIIGMSRMNELARMQRDFDAALRLSADGLRYNSEQLVDNVNHIDRLGASVEDATDVVRTFLNEGVRPEVLDRMGEAALNLAELTGQDLTEAAQEVAEAFTGGYEAVAEFDNKLNFLTLAEREQIRAMFDSGDASEARRIAFNAFYEDAEDGVDELETAWGRAMEQMGLAWDDFKNWLADTSFLNDLSRELNEAAIGFAYVVARARGLSHEEAGNLAVGNEPRRGAGFGAARGGGGNVDPLDTESERALKDESDRQYEEDQRRRNRRGRSGRTDADYQADFNRELERANRERAIQAAYQARNNVLSGEALINAEREQAIATALRQAEDRANRSSERNLQLSAEQRAEIERTVALEFDADNARRIVEARREEHESRVNELMQRRSDLTRRMEFAAVGTDDYRTLQSALTGVNLQLEQASQEAHDFYEALFDTPEADMLGLSVEELTSKMAALENQVLAVRAATLESARSRVETGMDELREMQGLLQEQIEFAQLTGESGRAGNLTEQLTEVNQRLVEGAQLAIDYWTAMRGNPDDLALMGLTPTMVDNIILGLENTIAASERLRTQFLKTGEALNRDLAQGGATAMEQFAQSIVKGENVLESFAQAFLQFAADFLLQIARMIAQQALFNAISAAGGGAPGGAGGAGGFLSGLIGGLFHGGGVVAKGGRGRNVAAAVFAGAARYHGGGIAGLKPDEVPAILQRGEEVLTREDARHRRNGGKGGGGRALSQVLAIGEEQIAAAMAGAAGGEVLVTQIRTNRATIRQELGID